jgi:hypothetical protein
MSELDLNQKRTEAEARDAAQRAQYTQSTPDP